MAEVESARKFRERVQGRTKGGVRGLFVATEKGRGRVCVWTQEGMRHSDAVRVVPCGSNGTAASS